MMGMEDGNGTCGILGRQAMQKKAIFNRLLDILENIIATNSSV